MTGHRGNELLVKMYSGQCMDGVCGWADQFMNGDAQGVDRVSRTANRQGRPFSESAPFPFNRGLLLG